MSEAATSKAPEEPLITHKTLAYRFTHRFTQALLFTFFRLRVVGREHLPKEGGALIASNHQSFIDIPIVAAANTSPGSRWLARACSAG